MSDFHERYLSAVQMDKKDNTRRLGALVALWQENHSEYWRSAEHYYGER
jgi:hypothetical protein